MENTIPAIIQQVAPAELPVQMSDAQSSAYKKYLAMDGTHTEWKNLKIDLAFQKEQIDKKHKENSDWIDVQDRKRDLQQQMNELDKEALEVLGEIHSKIPEMLDKATSLERNTMVAKKRFDEAALECAKDPLQVRLVLFDNEGFVSESVKFEAKLVKQTKPRKKNRENAFNKTQFIKETFELKIKT